MKKSELSKAIDNLAALYDNGALEVATDPVAFINRVIENIQELRELLSDPSRTTKTMKTADNPNPGELWKDDNFDWGTEPHIGTVTIVLSTGGLTSYIKENGDQGVMSTDHFLTWFYKASP
jgi:hypothetical protein